jgi:phosphomannomutase
MHPNIEQRIQSWLDGPYDQKTKEEIRHLLATNPQSLSDAFFKDLSFGTGGMRGILGVGTNRINIYTIRMATQGLAQYLLKQPGDSHTVFIGYDVRHHSREFAEETAKVFSGNGIRVLLASDICPTPLVSFACRYYRCSAAVMITASHNPPQYNGYKVYWSDGAQVVPPHDLEIMAEVQTIKSPDQVRLGSIYEEVGTEIDEAYLAELQKLQMLPESSDASLHIIYTNLHGTGIRLLPKALQKWGYQRLNLVEKQCSLDPDFTYAPSPNPEEEKALKLGMEQLKEEKADLLIATDPDADRIGVAIPQTRFTGNQIACLCLHHICKTLHEKGEFPENAAFIKTIVTTELFKQIAEGYGAKCIDVLTGFKYIAEMIGIWEKAFDGYQYLFGAEESYGYLFGTFVRDKDAISSACLIAEMAAAAKEEGHTLLDQLHQIYRDYGIHRETLAQLTFLDSQAGMEEMNALMKQLRQSPPLQIGGVPVACVEDYLHGQDPLPPSDVVRFWLGDGSKLVIRPSGTEPKVKIYVEVVQKAEQDLAKGIKDCDERLKKLTESFKQELHNSRPL